MKVLSEEKGYLKLLMEGADEGYATALAEELLKNKEITFASAVYDHPTKRNPILLVRGKNLKKEISRAVAGLEEKIHALEESLRRS